MKDKDKEKEELRRRLGIGGSDINDMEKNIKENKEAEKIKSPLSNKRNLPPTTPAIDNIKPTRGKAKTTAMSRNALAWALEGHSTKIKIAFTQKDGLTFDSAFKNLKSHYKFVGIMMIIVLGIYILFGGVALLVVLFT